MTAARVVETLDEVEDGHPRLGLRAELGADEIAGRNANPTSSLSCATVD